MKKVKMLLIAIYITSIVIALSANISFARYTHLVKGMDSSKVSKYCINLKGADFLNNSTTLNTVGIGGGYSYYFYVVNQDNSLNTSQVAINYKISILENSIYGTNLTYKLYKSDINKIRGDEVLMASIIKLPVNTTPIIQYYELVVSAISARVSMSNIQSKIVLDAENIN